MSKFISIAVLFFLSITLAAQRANTWYFGTNAGLDFNTTPPSPLNGGQINQPDNCSTISDASGNLLFYTNGVNVWNKNHAVMPNGSGLIGHSSAGQCALVIPLPCSSNKFVIFQVTEFASPGSLNYSVVDMNLNNGLGDVISGQKNVSLGGGWTEKLCAYYNPANNSYWLLSHKWGSDEFVAFKITSTSVATQSVVSGVGSIHNCGSYGAVHDAMGQLTISPDGTKVLNALTCQDKFELFDFNITSGVVSNLISIPGNTGNAWGTAFSPNSSKIYVTTIFGQSVYQYDISNYNTTAIVGSKTTLYTAGTGGYNFGYMELGPNGKLYIAKPNSGFLSVVNNPDLAGVASNFSVSGQSLGSNVSSHSTSRIAYNISSPATNNFSITTTNSLICAGQTTTLTVSGTGSFTWSNGSTASLITVSPINTNTYTITSSSGCSGNTSSAITVSVLPNPVLSITGPTNICVGQTISLFAGGANSYTWNALAGSQSITISPSVNTAYTLIGANSSGCTSTLTTNVNVSNSLTINVSGNFTICPGGTATLVATGAQTFTWNTSAMGSSISVSPLQNTTYTVSGVDVQNQCKGSASVNVYVKECVNVGLEISVNETSFHLYPQPVEDILFLKNNTNFTGQRFTIYDAFGKNVYTEIFTETNFNDKGAYKMNLSMLAPGIYFVEISDHGKMSKFKMIKE